MKISLEELKSRFELTEEIIGRHRKTDQSRLFKLKKKTKQNKKTNSNSGFVIKNKAPFFSCMTTNSS